jgi:hypothetical protein
LVILLLLQRNELEKDVFVAVSVIVAVVVIVIVAVTVVVVVVVTVAVVVAVTVSEAVIVIEEVLRFLYAEHHQLVDIVVLYKLVVEMR